MKFVVLACMLAVAAARPDKDATIVVDERTDNSDGNFFYNVQTSNGIEMSNTGTPGSQGQSNFRGYFRFPLDDGTFVEVTYVADEFGYRLVSDLPLAAMDLSAVSGAGFGGAGEGLLYLSPDQRSSFI